jgi:phosphoglycerate dehydrogenase-like enzyme
MTALWKSALLNLSGVRGNTHYRRQEDMVGSKVGVVGAGTMGAGIAQVTVEAGMK